MISILTVNYHSSGHIARLAESIRRHPPACPVELVITNNSSQDRIHLADCSKLSVRIIESDNYGYAVGINRAFEASRGEWVMVSNPDIRLDSGSLDAALVCLREHTEAGIILPRLVYPDGSLQRSVRRLYTWPVVLYARSPMRGLFRRPPAFFRHHLCENIRLDAPSAVDWGIGAAMFLRRRDFPDGRIFDERFFLYFEDVDLCYRTWQRGLRVLYCPHIVCVHEHRRHSRNPFSSAGLRHLQSLSRFVAKYGGLPKRPVSNGELRL